MSSITTLLQVSPPIVPLILSPGNPNLKLWLSVQKSKITFNATFPDQVSQWDDLSGTGNNATQGTSANQPLYNTDVINGFPAINFNGTSDFFNLDSTLLPLGGSGRTVFFLTDNIATDVKVGAAYGMGSTGNKIEIGVTPTEFAVTISGGAWGDNSLTNSGLQVYSVTFPENGFGDDFVFYKNGNLPSGYDSIMSNFHL